MAIKFLSAIDLGGLELINAKPQFVNATELAALSAGSNEGRLIYDSANSVIRFSDGTDWLDISGDIKSITGGDAISVTSGTSGDATVAVASSIAGNGLTWTSGVVAVGAGDGIEVTGTTVRFKNATGLTNNKIMLWDDTNGQLANSQITESSQVVGQDTVYTVNIGAANTVIAGNLTVQGTTTTVNSNTVSVGDNIIVLNADATGSATQDAGIEIERGDDANKIFQWNETNDYWETVGAPFKIGDVNTATSPTVNTNILTQGAGLSTPTERVTINTIGGLTGATKRYTVLLDSARDNVSFASNAYTVTHGLGSKLVMVQVIGSTDFETVHVDVERPTTNTIKITFGATPTHGDYYCMVWKIDNEDTAGNVGA